MGSVYSDRVACIRRFIGERGIDAIIISGTDPHSSEYPAERWKQVQWVSGFTGEAGDIVITSDHAGLWTDTRYFIQAEKQLAGTGIVLHKTRVPDEVLIPDWLSSRFSKDVVTVAFDGLCQSIGAVRDLESHLEAAYGRGGYHLVDLPDCLSQFWTDRPCIPSTSVTLLDEKTVGESRAKKIDWLRAEMASRGCGSMLLSSLDEIAWLLNVRGEDIDYNPYVISYLLITEKDVQWFVRDVDSVPSVAGVINAPYSAVEDAIRDARTDRAPLWLDPASLNYSIYKTVLESFGPGNILQAPSPIILRKALKNRREIEGFRKAFVEDGVAMEKFLYWLETQVSEGEDVTEWDASVRLTQLRSEIEGYHGNSFENISAYGENAALPHYSTPFEGSAEIEARGLYLVDSGGHYDCGTTDITRTVPMGRCTRQEKEDYTLVLKGMIDLSLAVFPCGTAGCQIDALSREPLWRGHRNFGHGTGHGIGFYSGVHEGPQSIRQNFLSQPLLPGMVTSNEPGLYREGKHGIRHENVILCVEDGSNEFASWLKFETLTCCHIDTSIVKTRLLSDEELDWLNSYNRRVYKTLKSRLTREEAKWLKKKCRKLRRGWFEW